MINRTMSLESMLPIMPSGSDLETNISIIMMPLSHYPAVSPPARLTYQKQSDFKALQL